MDTNFFLETDPNTGQPKHDNTEILEIPFDSGEHVQNYGDHTHTYVNYLLGVLIQEAGPTPDSNPVDDEMLKAMAIAARTVAYANCLTDTTEILL